MIVTCCVSLFVILANAQILLVSSGVTFKMEVGGWDSIVSGSSSMTGHWANNLTAINVSGNAYEEARISAASHTSQQDAGRVALPQSIQMTLEEAIARMRFGR